MEKRYYYDTTLKQYDDKIVARIIFESQKKNEVSSLQKIIIFKKT